jgi:hypothetical protein
MKKRAALLAVIAILVLPFQFPDLMAQDPQSGHGSPEPPKAGVQLTRGEAQKRGGPPTPNMSWHGGAVMHGTEVFPIFWGGSWGNANLAGDKIDGIMAFYGGIGGQAYAGTNVEYTDGSGKTSSAVHSNLYRLDVTQAPSSGNTTSPILAEVCKQYPNPTSGGYYPVYVDTPRGSAGFCAWHSAGSCNGVPVQFAFFFNLDGDAACSPGGSTGWYTSGHTNSQGLAAVANVSGHELSEMLTDPRLNAWYDNSGSENADKCAWTFGQNLLPFKDANGVTTSMWKIQGNWSNAAYNANKSLNGKIGCIYGTN